MNARAWSPRSLACAACAALVAGCGGGGGGTDGSVPALSSPASITARFSFTVPPATTASASTRARARAAKRNTTYISPSSQSLEIDVVTGTTTTTGTTLNLSPLPATCSVSGGTTQCDVAVVAPANVTSFVITFYDQPNEQGNILSTATVAAPPAVNGVATITATLLPVVATIALDPVTPLTNGQPASTAVTVTALDADGNLISGSVPFSASVQLIPASSAIVFTPSTLTSPATALTVTYSGTPNADTHVTAQTGSTSYVTQLPIVGDTATPTPTPSPGATPTPSPTTAPGALTIAPSDTQLTVGGPGMPIVVAQAGGTGTIALTATCNAGALITLSQATVPAGTSTSVTVTAVAAPATAVTHACTIAATFGAQTATGFVDVNQNTATVDGRARIAR